MQDDSEVSQVCRQTECTGKFNTTYRSQQTLALSQGSTQAEERDDDDNNAETDEQVTDELEEVGVGHAAVVDGQVRVHHVVHELSGVLVDHHPYSYPEYGQTQQLNTHNNHRLRHPEIKHGTTFNGPHVRLAMASSSNGLQQVVTLNVQQPTTLHFKCAVSTVLFLLLNCVNFDFGN